MQTQNINNPNQNEGAQQPANNPQQGGNTVDERDEKIKNEPDTARIRSERQSVIDGEQKENKGQ
jgi:hypothetical protein